MTRVHAIEDRAQRDIRFPNAEGYRIVARQKIDGRIGGDDTNFQERSSGRRDLREASDFASQAIEITSGGTENDIKIPGKNQKVHCPI